MDELIALVAEFGVQTFLENTFTFVALINREGHLESSNPVAQALGDAASIKGAAFVELLAPESHALFRKLVKETLEKQDVKKASLEFVVGAERNSLRFNCFLTPAPGNRLLFFGEPAVKEIHTMLENGALMKALEKSTHELEIAKQVLDRKQKELQAVIAQAEEVSHTDPLTFLPNRKQILGDLQREVNHAERYNSPLTVSMLDIDHFKKVNDTFGHAVGDEVLRILANLLRENVRHPDFVGRYGGEEFLLILPNSKIDEAGKQAARLCKIVRNTEIKTNQQVVKLTISIGVAQFRIGQDHWQDLLQRADTALYQAKNNGRDQWAALDEIQKTHR
ncbi:MAG: GGDEF domain-containing protein [Anaerolineales bacterium]|nr:GGDEF domain-containing protein [Anaerolineales bacterium]